MDVESEMVAAAAFLLMSSAYVLLKKKSRRELPSKRRWWMVSLNRSRIMYNSTHLLEDLLKEPSGLFENFCRMSAEDFEILLQKIGPRIAKKDTKWREAIPANVRLALTLRFLATGDSFRSLHYLFKISPQLISQIIPEVCTALMTALNDSIKITTRPEEWRTVAESFENNWHFPHCVGAVDGKHIMMESPINTGTEYFNYKGFFSVVLMGLVDASYCFTFVDCECQGRLSDGGVFRNTELFRLIENRELNLPPDEPLHGENTALPYVFVADDAFALSTCMMKPYPGVYAKGSIQRIFNYRLSRARRIVENVFGIMSSTFRVLRKPLLLQPDKVTIVAMTCALLHNFLRKSETSRSRYSPLGTFDSDENGKITPGTWRQDTDNMSSFLSLQKVPRKPSLPAKQVRDTFAEYFITRGKVSWQDTQC